MSDFLWRLCNLGPRDELTRAVQRECCRLPLANIVNAKLVDSYVGTELVASVAEDLEERGSVDGAGNLLVIPT